jgi:multicomponent Na+:H+ antiporter subunit B
VTSLILQTAARFLLPLLLLAAILLLYRGHNQPGGGFISGLVAAAAYALYSIAFDVPAARRALRVDPFLLIGLGLLSATLSGVLALIAGEPFLTGQWSEIAFFGGDPIHIGSPLLFDIGVFLVVVGVVVTAVLALGEE